MAASPEGSAGAVHNFSCLQDIPQLECVQRAGPDNASSSSQLVCSAGDADQRAAFMYNSLVAVNAIILPLVVTLNLAVVVTILLNRKLHTVVNVLVIVLGVNNLLWTALPIVVAKQVKRLLPFHCALRAFLFITTRGVSFTVIVTITLVRYLVVVRNHSYPCGRRNVLMFVSIAVLPSLVKWFIRRSHQVMSCSPVVASNPDGFLLIAKFENTIDFLTAIIAVVEYGGGLGILGFCYSSILITTVRSRKRVRANENARKRGEQGELDAEQRPSARNQQPKRRCGLVDQNGCFTLHGSQQNDTPPLPFHRGLSVPGTSALHSSSSSTQLTGTTDGLEKKTALSDKRANMTLSSVSSRSAKATSVHQSAASSAKAGTKPSQGASKNLEASMILVQPINGETSTGSVPRNHLPALGAQGGQDGASAGVTLIPMGINDDASGTSSVASLMAVPRPHLSRRRTQQQSGRVDIVATLSMTAFIVILFLVIFPYTLGVGLANSRSVCVITAEMRIIMLTIVLGSSGLGALLSPIVLVLFSADFKMAFCNMCGRAMRRFRLKNR